VTTTPDRPFENVLVEHTDRITWITLDRAEKRNAMNLAAQADLRAALSACRDTAKVVVITGNGPAFCAGVDLAERREQPDKGLNDPILASFGNTWVQTNMAVIEHPAVVIAAVNGFALGGGVTLVNSCDLAIAADDAQLGLPEVTFGAYPAYSGPSTQLRTLPKAAAWLILSGEKIDGPEAARIGLVNKSVPRERLREEVQSLAERISAFDAQTLATCKRALHELPERASGYQDAIERGALIGRELRVIRALDEEQR
jgi:enoyl-CoA hydratase/carnithine racemase